MDWLSLQNGMWRDSVCGQRNGWQHLDWAGTLAAGTLAAADPWHLGGWRDYEVEVWGPRLVGRGLGSSYVAMTRR